MTETFTVTKEVKYSTLWDALWGSDGSGMSYWCDMIRQADGGDIDLWLANPDGYPIPNVQDFKVHDAEEDKWHTVTLEDLARAYRHAEQHNLTHCGSYAITDLEQADSCTGDTLIQLAIFNEVVYG